MVIVLFFYAPIESEYFYGWLVEGLGIGYGDSSNSGRPLFDPVSMFKESWSCRRSDLLIGGM